MLAPASGAGPRRKSAPRGGRSGRLARRLRFHWNHARGRAACGFQFVEIFVRQFDEVALLIAILRMNGDAEIKRYRNVELERLQLALVLGADATDKA